MNKNMQQEDQKEEAVADSTGAGYNGPILNPSPNEPVEIENVFLRILGYHLFTDKILSFLNFEDLKALSAISKICCVIVRDNKEFAKRASLIICRESVATQVLQKTSYEWRHISIELPIPDPAPELVTKLLKLANSVRLCLSIDTAVDSLETKHYLTEILSETTKLESLEMDTSIFINELTDVLSMPMAQTLLANLKVLIIKDKARKVCWIDDEENGEDLRFERNFRQLAEVAFNLKKFVLGKVILEGNEENDCHHVKFIPQIVNASKETLEDLELNFNVWKLDEMKEIRCPKLKRLVLSAHGPKFLIPASRKDSEIVEGFLRNQPLLEELVIDIKGYFPISTVHALQERVAEMKKLHIKARNIETSEPVNWSFLETMNELKDFQIRRPTTWCVNQLPDYFGCGEEFLAKLPATVEKVSIQGFEKFWKEPPAPLPVPKRNIGEVLSRFVNLTGIDLFWCKDALTDDGLQSLITNCKKLTSLMFSKCEQLTDFGVSGVKTFKDGTSEEKVGVSLKDLKGLIRLKIRCCRRVSLECLLTVVEFDFLRYFDYDGKVTEPKTFLGQVLRQNPCLEEVFLKSRGHDGYYRWQLQKEINESNPRVRIIEIPINAYWTDGDDSSLSDGNWTSVDKSNASDT